MIAYNIQNGQPRQRQKDPLDGGYLMPANCTDVKPPDFDFKTHTCKFDGAKWVTSKIPDPPKEKEPEPETAVLPQQQPPPPKVEEPEPYVETYKDKRLKEYGCPANQIEFITENGLKAWQTKVTKIKAKFPKP
jgi:hypothetical protein